MPLDPPGDPARPPIATSGGDPSIRTRSRGWGAVVLLVVLILALGVPPLIRLGVAGRPFAIHLPVAPAVGSCLLIDARSVTTTACTEPHDAEVARTWEADESAVPGLPFAQVAANQFDESRPNIGACWDAQFGYLDYDGNDASGNWTPSKPNVIAQLIAAPPGARTPTRGWTACVLAAPDGGQMTGSLRGGYSGYRPAESRLASCVRSGDINDAAGWTNCAEPHRIEVLATFDPAAVISAQGIFIGMPTDDILTSSCQTLAATMTATTDLSFGGRIRIAATSLNPASLTEISAIDADGRRLTTYLPVPLCYVELLGDGELDGTVIGLGDAALPLG